jgi:hypothetical protein
MARGDPYWITAKFDSPCSGCKTGQIRRGQRAFFYPRTRDTFGSECGCGETMQNSFDAAVADETFYNAH